jgi:hypothetical protein
MEELPQQWKESIIVPLNKKGDKTDCSNYRGISLLLTMYKILYNILLSNLTPYAEESVADHLGGFQATGQLLTTYSAFVKYLRKNESKQAVHQLFIDLKKVYDSIRWEALYNILIESGIPMKLVWLIKMCRNETYSRVWVGKHLFDMFRIRNGLKQADDLSPLLFNFALGYAIRWLEIKCYTSASGLC